MKKLRTAINIAEKWRSCGNKLNQRWLALPLQKQQRYILYFFIGYLLLTAAVLLNIFNSPGKSNEGITIEHIENPLIKTKVADTIPHY